ncbi:MULTISPECIES: cytochrome-c peroxidase [Chryseobacterium]|uniref:Cytochrome c peroxidase n=1 Tax=Chryseobacterium camelliae TaxID=1265445 RepID=A0ABU0TED9_9FLAO|nr:MULTISPECIES: cytochrome-c peroxidase [Chryseobacterium]MDT3406770.1 cytochrome c peroxidase [Pseudacidovorax intermedius]MDQ1095434.1 cytochrome c peroxidase [Chryseobacterium camelliae]MDQ1099374.1 cytochrome c peroxidase [Chryseobacterium sp. SORGH_AS_1048]MDR6086720.1 cytochrome c peroxidase [Chryseobacterium sp. SORGH_AS_0909]MDR6131092.1 cytochrome c peroxidase [Chryseobacterium sp. SORGH_AS_1175]
MKILLKYPLSVFLFIVFTVFGALQCTQNQQPVNEDLAEVKKDIFRTNTDFLNQTNALIRMVSGKPEQAVLQQQFEALRTTYKNMEWAVEYFLPQTARFINGPALPEIEMQEHVEIEPEGLQVLEELLYPYDPANRDEVIRMLKNLTNKSNAIKVNFQAITISKDQVFDALRQEVFRISSLGIAGFDTPVSGTSLKEMPHALNAVKKILQLIATDRSKEKSLVRISTEIEAAVLYLNHHPDKNTFDYITFIPKHLNTITSLMIDFRNQEEIPAIEVTSALNKNVRTFYSKNAFDPNAFVPGKEFEMSPEKVQLGKRLFNDKILSDNHTRSCATCHIAEKAFTDGVEKAMSLTDSPLKRNTPSLSYSAFQHGQFWDMRKDDLEGQSSDVITNKEEMHGDLSRIIAKINSDPEYRTAFRKIYKGRKTEIWQLQNVLASYIRSLAAFNSDFDRYMRGDQHAMTENQKKGFNLFMGKAQCAICHFLPLFNGTVPPNYTKTEQEVLGVAENASNKILDRDPGRGKFHETIAFLQHSFKTSTLRNIGKTGPYMHNGGYRTLKEVMDFYNKGGGKGFGLKADNQTLSDAPLNLSDKEISDLIDFLNALNDH